MILLDLTGQSLIYFSESQQSVCPYVVSSSAPSLQRSRAFLAPALLANSTMPFPVVRPRSSVITTARSTGPN